MLLSVLAAAAALATPVPPSDILAVDTRGTLRVVDRSGRTVRRLHWKLREEPQAIELTADRRGAFISLWRADAPPQLVAVDLAAGKRRELANAISPALSPDKTRLAFVVVEGDSEVRYLTALAIRTLRTGSTRTIAFAQRIPLGTPPELVVNWSPDGRHIVFFNGTQVAIVDAARTAMIPTRSPPRTASMSALGAEDIA